MDVRAAVEAAKAAKAKTIHEDLMDKAKDIKELQQKMRGYIKELELEVERVGVGNTGRRNKSPLIITTMCRCRSC
ncbi:hypothetical protein Pyn_34505 [Prunus yedoensis var. nudiflora]|uniref:Uncharacterized protein n=1 Tax=Prunus yedoensis var. nudiflora TaxID=2094558 RepID=A0A314ZT03_PRUYE|nr:hypothetical protein Pyn_34505 [Prunus yedoensis var. nudiflora]